MRGLFLMSLQGAEQEGKDRGGLLVSWKTRPAHCLAGVRKRDAHYSSRRATRGSEGPRWTQFDAPQPPVSEAEGLRA